MADMVLIVKLVGVPRVSILLERGRCSNGKAKWPPDQVNADSTYGL